MSGLTRDEAREQVARAIRHARLREHYQREIAPEGAWASISPGMQEGHRSTADTALSVLWPEVERLTRERDDHYDDAREQRMRAINAETEVERIRAELAHAHAVIARHVEPRGEGGK